MDFAGNKALCEVLQHESLNVIEGLRRDTERKSMEFEDMRGRAHQLEITNLRIRGRLLGGAEIRRIMNRLPRGFLEANPGPIIETPTTHAVAT